MSIFLGLLFGSIGTVYMIWGKRQSSVMYIVVGAILLVYPYLFSNAILIFITGAILTAIPYARHRGLI
ncbi:MAG: amino acid transport protein [Acidobacteria bacterium]|nr:amino acid transport protein [Acidobacteriota bacterium]MBV9068431.1 amino acid transport protein [Acidobacteriota bacterium]MBV9188721.1 amino acid transport protein [Acidobacteriota bacterium]